MATAKEKFLELLKLLNNIRISFDGLHGVVQNNVQNAEEYCTQAGDLYERALDCRSQVQQSGKVNGVIKKELALIHKELQVLQESFVGDMSQSKSLYTEYSNNAKECCDVYKKMEEKNGRIPSIEKGYRQQVMLIQKIRAKIKELIKSFSVKQTRFDEIASRIEATLNGMEIISQVKGA